MMDPKKKANHSGKQGNVLIVEDDSILLEVTSAALVAVAANIFTAASAEDALDILRSENIDLVISDIRLPGLDGLSMLRQAREEHPGVRCVLITGHGSMETAIEALRLGAVDFLTKPVDIEDLRQIARRFVQEPNPPLPIVRVTSDSGAPAGRRAPEGLYGESPVFLRSLETARKAALAGSSVLISGESGTGKEGVARFIHDTSDRRNGPFIAVNCGAVPENLIESELFGHVRGAFTGAYSDRPGKFALARGGTLFLDEIGEMPANMQVRLLRTLQEHVVEPVGGGPAVPTDFRLIAATNRDLREEVRTGRFREDLWFRLHVIPVNMPPLRERDSDVILLAKRFLEHFNARYGTSYGLSAENEAMLLKHSWPGNVRELVNAVERAVVLSASGRLVFQLDDAAEEGEGDAGRVAVPSDHSVRGRRRTAERGAILEALEACRWNKTRTAERLGISRRGLLYKIKEYGIGQ
jgi:DNA-binding NtrC family response regulator